MRRNVVPQTQLITRVNVTPIIDVALVLVIILLVTAPMLSVADLPVDLPQARTREAEDQRNVSVTLGASGQLAVDDEVIPPDSAARQAVAAPGRARQQGRPGRDPRRFWRAVRGRPHSAHPRRAAGAKRLAIATRQKFRPANEPDRDDPGPRAMPAPHTLDDDGECGVPRRADGGPRVRAAQVRAAADHRGHVDRSRGSWHAGSGAVEAAGPEGRHGGRRRHVGTDGHALPARAARCRSKPDPRDQ